MSRQLKQLLYGGFYLGIIIFFIIPFYNAFLKPTPSCFDKVQNQNEEGVDCGGVCSQICLPADLAPISLAERPRIFTPFPGRLSILVALKNPNAEYGANLQYKIFLEDATGQVLGVTTQDEVLFSSQIKYILLPNFSLEGADKVTQARVEVLYTDWLPQAFISQPRVSLRNEITQEEEGVIRVRGTVVNEDIKAAERVNIVALIVNEWGGTLGASATVLENLAPGEVREFSISHPKVPNVNFDETKVFIAAR
ncbi:MAG: FxLYD domain-containing protein [Anaplasmataceae bacterium]|nr:FxLYD domain-containing protein [Anaplasmataceae bacterium]